MPIHQYSFAVCRMASAVNFSGEDDSQHTVNVRGCPGVVTRRLLRKESRGLSLVTGPLDQ